MRIFLLILFISLASGCSTKYTNQSVTGKAFPAVTGQTLEENMVNIPADFNKEFTLLLVGYKQNSQTGTLPGTRYKLQLC